MEQPNLNEVPAKALNCSTRLLLGQYLNPEQHLLSSEGYARDYRGLAEQMDFQYNEIRNFQRNENPTLKILEVWTNLARTTIGQLVQYLENMGRHDVIQDLQLKFEADARLYFQKRKSTSHESPLQVPEVTSCRLPDSRCDDLGILTRDDANTGEYTYYDAFVCYADEDLQFVSQLVRYLESEEVGLKFFIRTRDMLAGHSEYETSMQLIQERCKRVLIILSPDFLKCPACEVQASFAAGLGIDERCRKLIPVVYKPCEIPLMLKFISKIDFTKPGVQDWIWEKLISSLHDGPPVNFISTERRNIPMCLSLPQLDSGLADCSNPAITFPSSIQSSAISIASCSTSSPSIVIQEVIPSSSSNVVFNSTSSVVSNSTSNVIPNSTAHFVKTPKQKSKLQNLRFWKSPKRADSSFQTQDCSATSISSSNATSGFHSSASDDNAESFGS